MQSVTSNAVRVRQKYVWSTTLMAMHIMCLSIVDKFKKILDTSGKRAYTLAHLSESAFIFGGIDSS
jgi:hypothetical protein